MTAERAHRPRTPPRARHPTRALSRLARHALALIGIHRRIKVDGVVYRERSIVPLDRALRAETNPHKDYDVRFPNRDRMRIRVTPDRMYPDLTGPRVPEASRVLESLVRPGARVLNLACARGHVAAWLSVCVGPSGSVVALDRDNESIRYARRRHTTGNIAFEVGGLDEVVTELDGAFDGVVLTHPPQPREDASPQRHARELWRLTAAGGWLLLPRALAPTIRRCAEHDPDAAGSERPTPLPRLVLIGKAPRKHDR